jgi:hypothetical protein
MRCEDTECYYLAHDRGPVRALVNTIVNPGFTLNAGNILTSRAINIFSRTLSLSYACVK